MLSKSAILDGMWLPADPDLHCDACIGGAEEVCECECHSGPRPLDDPQEQAQATVAAITNLAEYLRANPCPFPFRDNTDGTVGTCVMRVNAVAGTEITLDSDQT